MERFSQVLQHGNPKIISNLVTPLVSCRQKTRALITKEIPQKENYKKFNSTDSDSTTLVVTPGHEFSKELTSLKRPLTASL